MSARFIVGDTREVTASLADGSVDLILTSPPFLALRSYLPADHESKHLEIGSEANPAAFIDVLLELTAEWRRILAPHGSIVIELGDTYSGSGGAGGDYNVDGLREGQAKFRQSPPLRRAGEHFGGQHRLTTDAAGRITNGGGTGWPLPKSLALVPELYRVALAYGINPLTGQPSPAGRWRVRNVVRWVRPNPPVGALGDKFRPATSDLVVACVAGDRWFDLDAVRTEGSSNTHARTARGIERYENHGKNAPGPHRPDGAFSHKYVKANDPSTGSPPLDWWQIVPGGFSGAHYAVWPPTLCERPIEAMCPRRVCRECGKPSRRIVETERTLNGEVLPDGAPMYTATGQAQRTIRGQYDHLVVTTGQGTFGRVVTAESWSSCGCPNSDGLSLDGYHTGSGWRPGLVYDPFAGSGTTLVVAHGHSRDSIGADLDPRNADLAKERLGMFLEVETTGSVA